jgi:hypothetical protein
MALIILIVGENGLGTLIKVGAPPVANGPAHPPPSWTASVPGSMDGPITFATQIKAWKAPRRTFRFMQRLMRNDERVPLIDATTSQSNDDPLSTLQGDCLYDTKSLFAYDGPQSAKQVAFVLWEFAVQPQPGDSGAGRLNLGAGVTAGDLYWEIIFPPDPPPALPSFGSWSGATETRRLRRR